MIKIKNPILNRIFELTFRSIIFWSIVIAFILSTIIIDSIFVSSLEEYKNQPRNLVNYNYTTYAIFCIFIVSFKIFFSSKFWMKDKINGILNIEYRSDFSMSKIFLTRVISGGLIALIVLLFAYVINVMFFVFTNNIYYQMNLLNRLIVIIAITLIGLFVNSIFIMISQYQKQILMGIIGGMFILTLPLNMFFNLLTNLANNSHDDARTNIKYMNTEKTHNLIKENETFKQMVDSYQTLPTFLEYVGDGTGLGGWDKPSTYLNLLAEGGLLFYYSQYRQQINFFSDHFEIENLQDFEENKALGLGKLAHDLFKFDDKLCHNDTSKCLNQTNVVREIWANSYFSENANKTISLEGDYNFNQVVHNLKNHFKDDKAMLEIINFTDLYTTNVLTSRRNTKSSNLLEKRFLYEEHGPSFELLETNATPGVMLFEKALMDIISSYYLVDINYGLSEKNEDINLYANKMIKRKYLDSFLNPFYVVNEMQMYNFFNNKYQRNVIVNSSSIGPIATYEYFKFELNNHIKAEAFPKESIVKKIERKNLSYLLAINYLLCLSISLVMLYVAFILFKKLLRS